MTITTDYVISLVEKGKRVDGRKFDEFRTPEIETGVIERAEGSARVRFGKTDVIVGVKIDTATPFPDKPDAGIMMVNAELSPIASTMFERGPPSEQAIELSRVVDRGIRESHSIDLEKLCIEPKEKVWGVFIDVYVMNHDGNLLDAAALAAIAALWTAKMPQINEETGKADYEGEKTGGPLPMKAKPIAVTLHKIGGKFLVDPTFDEGESATARLTVTTMDSGSLCSLQKDLAGLTVEEIGQAFELSSKIGKELRKLIK